MKMIEVLEEEMNKSHKEIQEDTNNWGKQINPKKKQQLKETNKTAQDLNLQIKATEKTQTEGT